MTYICSQPFYQDEAGLAVHVIWDNPVLGPIPFVASSTDTDTVYGPEIYAQAVAGDFGPVVSYADSHWYSTYSETIGNVIVSPTGTQPADSTQLVPPTPAEGQTLQWDGSAWVLASFDITLSLPDAKTSLINTASADGAAAVDAEVGLFSAVQLIKAPDVDALETKTYQPATLGQYQIYINTNVAQFTNQVNAATTVPGLYPLNPATVPTNPNPPAISGQLHITRTGLNLTNAFYHTLTGTTAQYIQLRIVATNTTLNTNADGQYPATSNCFTSGNYNIELIYGFTTIGTFNVTDDGTFMHYDFSYTP